MVINSNTYKIRKNSFTPDTRLALEFFKVDSGNYKVIDRTSAEDDYWSSFQVYSTQLSIDSFLDDVNFFRNSSSVYIPTTFNNEPVFGANIDYSAPINCVYELQPKTQNTLKGFSVNVRVNALSPAFTGSSSLPEFRNLEIGWFGDSKQEISYLKSYTNQYTYNDRKTDIGIFEGVFKFSDSDMRTLRNYQRTNRGLDTSLVKIYGVDEPFGPYRAGSYPYTVKIIEILETPYSADSWKCKIKFAEVV
jgi:hypothetical protein